MNRLKKYYKNLPIRSKIMCSIGITVFITIILLIIANINLAVVSSKYEQAISGAEYRYSIADDINGLMSDASRNVMTVRYNYNNKSSVNIAKENIYNNLDDTFILIDDYINSTNGDYYSSDEYFDIQMDIIDDLVAAADEYVAATDKIIEYGEKGDLQSLIATDAEFDAAEEKLNGFIDELMYIAYEESAESTDTAYNISFYSTVVIIVVGILLCVLSVVFGIITSSAIVKPLKKLTKLSTKVAEGNFDVDLSTNANDEIGILANNINDMICRFGVITDEITKTRGKIEEGSLSVRIDSDNHQGAYKDTVESVNSIIEIFENDTWSILNSIKEYAGGNFDFEAPEFPGGKHEFNLQLDKFRKSLKNIENDLTGLIDSAIDGDFSNKIDEQLYTGDWQKLIANLNRLVANVAEPIDETCRVLKEIERANFSVHIEGEYNGSFEVMKNAINSTIDSLKLYIKDISRNLTAMANKNLDIDISVEYDGDFVEIKNALNLIINNFNTLIKQIEDSADKVSVSANSMAETGSELARGAETQSQSIDNMVSSFGSIAEKTKENSENSVKAYKLTANVNESIADENAEMKSMVNAMTAINEASSNISGIIKVIEGIAFQTNILALNAAIEAARAGVHGKGFAVVADEVRNLALRSTKAVEETSQLIETSLEKVGEGMTIANNTAERLEAISNLIGDVANIVNAVNNTEQQQYELVSEINNEISKINDVVNKNTITSTQSASSSQELASMATVLKEYVSDFELKKD